MSLQERVDELSAWRPRGGWSWWHEPGAEWPEQEVLAAQAMQQDGDTSETDVGKLAAAIFFGWSLGLATILLASIIWRGILA